MKNNWILSVLLAFAPLFVVAQPEDEPVYYTDSEVETQYVSFGVHFDPMFTQRRLFSLNNAGVNNGLTEDDFPATGGFGYNWGAYANFNINSNLRLGIGAGQTTINYRLDEYEYILNNDTSSVGLNINARYNTIPLRIGFTTAMNDAWDLEIWIPVAYNRLVSYSESATVQGMEINEDLTDEASWDMWSVAIQVGGAFYFTDNWAVTTHAQFRYFTTQIIDKPNRPVETPYGVGLSVGLRYSL